MDIYLVGGAVRDKLLGLPVKERDWVVVGATTEYMLSQGFKQVGKDFPVFLHPKSGEEYALARTERKRGHGYTGFEVHASPDVTLEEDLRRRDLTINAIAEKPDGKLIDPFDGVSDLNNGWLRHVSPAFSEDPVRVLRVARFAARFAQWDFRVTHATNKLMIDMVNNGEVDHLVPERVWAETNKALDEERPERFFEALRACHALEKIFPELEKLFGVAQPKKYHPEIDTGVHTLMVLQQAVRLSEDTKVRFAALVHDLGKGTTPKDKLPSHRGHEKRSADLIKQLCQRLRIPNDYCDLAVQVALYHSICHRAFKLKPETLLKTLKALNAFRRPQCLQQFLLTCEADARGRTGMEEDDYPQAELFRKALDAANRVKTNAWVAEGLSGPEIGRRLHEQRLEAIRIMREGIQKP